MKRTIRLFPRIRLFAAGILFILPYASPAVAVAGGAPSDGQSVIANIAICMIGASVLGIIMTMARQPVILGHILAGIVIGPIGIGLITGHADIMTISQIGLILLLFMIGLEIDLHKMFASGKLVILPGLLQFPICVVLGYAAFYVMETLGFSLPPGSFTRLYCAIAIAISSTMIVVKLLYDKFEMDTLAGRITVGILVFQDIWAIIILALQPNLADPNLLGILRTFLSGALLVAAAFVVSKHILPHIFRSVAKLPELLLVISLGWCFLVAMVAARPEVGLSMEMGALIAGVSLATFPYNMNVIAKVVSIRDFFITIFFVSIGMQIPVPELSVILTALSIAAVAVIVRLFGIFGILHPLRAGHRVSLLTTINLSQVSEFSLVILTIGVAYNHIPAEAVTPLIWVFSILAVASTYLITYSHRIQHSLSGLLKWAGLKDIPAFREEYEAGAQHPIVVLGFYRVASAFLDEAARKNRRLLKMIKVIDFNPLVKERLDEMGVACVYGDISNLDILHHADIHHARVILCSIPDQILKGTTNLKLLRLAKSLCPDAKIILTAEGQEQARRFFEEGADYVLEPAAIAGDRALTVIEKAMDDALGAMKEEALIELANRREVIT